MAEARTRYRVAVVGGDTLLAREIQDLLQESKPAPSIELISASSETAAVLSGVAEEAIPLSPLSAVSLAAADVAFLAGSPASSRKALRLNPPDGPLLIDLTGALEDQSHARLRAPSAEPGGASPVVLGSVQTIAHPAAIGIAMLLAALSRKRTIRRSLVHVFEPASERGKKGVDELQQQTIAVLNLKKLKTEVFDAQLSFNLLARYGEEAAEPIEGVEQRVEKNVASLLSAYPAIPMPSLRLIQAPVFHGHSFSLWVEFDEAPTVKTLAAALEEDGIDVRLDEPPSNANVAGQSGLSAGAIALDSNQPRAAWIWAVTDNFRLAAENAVAVAKERLV
ncbi:MAG TPA: Asd/ArgC dimerization domain-containing protein [Bryobacteraceae bacterium]|nr:Asd/ArgC dimerization domain-containing protein [Bryobacteraceae bacterium]